MSTQATTFANIPHTLIEEEKQLKAKITYLEEQINRKSTNELQDELFDVKQAYRNLVSTIEINYKSYYDLKYNTQVLSLNDIQKWLVKDITLIAYFYGNDAIYIITTAKNSKHIEKVEVTTDLEALLKESYNLLNNPKSKY